MAKSKAELKIGGMTCQGCVRGVELKLSKVPGVESAHVDLGAGRATVEYDDTQADVSKLVAAVQQIGYEAGLA
jgi:copper chaperone CopZ